MSAAPYKRRTVAPQDIADELVRIAGYMPETREAVVVVTLLGHLGFPVATAASRHAGRRIVRLTYQWDAIAPHVAVPIAGLRDVLEPLLEPGHVLRARVREARQVQA